MGLCLALLSRGILGLFWTVIYRATQIQTWSWKIWWIWVWFILQSLEHVSGTVRHILASILLHGCCNYNARMDRKLHVVPDRRRMVNGKSSSSMPVIWIKTVFAVFIILSLMFTCNWIEWNDIQILFESLFALYFPLLELCFHQSYS